MHKLYLQLALCLSFGYAFGQENQTKKVKYRKTMPIFLELASGINNSKFIDFGTSPLYYQGNLGAISLCLRKSSTKREYAYSGAYSLGNYSMIYNSAFSQSTSLFNLSVRHSRLYQLDFFTNKKWNLKAGATADAQVLMRSNPTLMNNQFGLDVFINVMGSSKISRDISNSTTKKLWFIKIKPKDRKLAFQLDCGLINTNYRNDYIYSNSTAIYNGSSILGAHSLKVFSGFRMSSRLDYEHVIFGNNTLKYSYVWDAMMSGKDKQDRMQVVNNFYLISLNIKFR